MTRDDELAALARAKARLDTLHLYPRPVRTERVRIRVAPWFFKAPGLRRFHGYTLHGNILVRRERPSDDLVTHELCHIWQLQHHPVRMPLSFFKTPYKRNGYEREARWAVDQTRGSPVTPTPAPEPDA